MYLMACGVGKVSWKLSCTLGITFFKKKKEKAGSSQTVIVLVITLQSQALNLQV